MFDQMKSNQVKFFWINRIDGSYLIILTRFEVFSNLIEWNIFELNVIKSSEIVRLKIKKLNVKLKSYTI